MKIQTWFCPILSVVLLVACDNAQPNKSGAVIRPIDKVMRKKVGNQNCQAAAKCADGKIEDITADKGYQAIVLPIGQAIAGLHEFALPQEETSESTTSMTDFFAELAKSKNWFVMTGGLAKIKGAKDIRYSNAASQDETPTVIQTRYEVYIDSPFYTKMTDQQKGQLLLNQLVLSLYIDQYEKSADLLQRVAMIDDKAKTDESQARAKTQDDDAAVSPPMQPFTSLTQADLLRRNTFTKFLLSGSKNITSENLYKAVRASFQRTDVEGAAGFARPYQYKHADSQE